MTDTSTHPQGGEHTSGHGGHGWMMMICCIPMLVIAALLVGAGVVSPGFLLWALGCTVMMAMMMRGMNHGGSGPTSHDHDTHAGHDRYARR